MIDQRTAGAPARAAADTPFVAALGDGSPPGRRLTIVHAVAPAPFGGLETVLRSLAAGFIARGHAVHIAAVVTPDSVPHAFVETLRAEGIPVHEMVLSTRDYLTERRMIAELCRSVGADVLHTHGYRPDVIDSGIARRLGIPRVTTVHGFCGGDWKGRIYERLQIRAYRAFDGVVAVARSQLDLLTTRGVPTDRTHLLPNAWMPSPTLGADEARAALGIPPSAFHIGWVGRMSTEKGPDIFVESLAHLAEIPFVASIIGDGPHRVTLQGRVRELGLEDRVRWHGSLPDAGQYFPAFDMFALSSRTEGTPMVLLEAMAARVPIVASAVGGVPHLLSSDEATLVTPLDPEALGRALVDAFEDGGGAAQRAEAAHARLLAESGADSWLDRHEELYRELMATYRN